MNKTIITILSDYIHIMNIVFILTIIFVERKKTLYTLFWITILIFTSYIGFIFYLIFGLSFRKKRITNKFYKRNLFRRALENRSEGLKKLEPWSQLIDYFELTGKSRLTFSNNIKIYTVGDDLFKDIIEDIYKAKKFIHLECFIFQYDNLGRSIADLLIKKARDGVEVKLILDGVGSSSIPRSLKKRFKEAGIELEIFFPLYFPFIHLRINYRTHRKLLIIDGKSGYMGGFNIGDNYLGKGPLGSWRDTHIRLKGSALLELQKEFFLSWTFTKKQRLFKFKKEPPLHFDHDLYFPKFSKGEKCPLQVVGSAPDYDFRLIRDGFIKIISSAKKYIYIQTPYFIPDDITYEALKLAALSGVKIKIMIPDKPDHIIVFWASLSYIGEFLNYGVDFYRYNNGFLHSKVIISDDIIASVGSSNFDHRSFYQNFEINSFFYDEQIVKKLKKLFINDLKNSSLISKEIYNKRSLVTKAKESVCRLFSPIL